MQLEDVVARAKELWLLEYRFQGDAEARGAFLLRPARLVRVEPARLEVRSGTLSLGSHRVARAVTGTLEVTVKNLDVPKTEGASVFHDISTRAELELRRGDLDFFDAYLDAPQAKVSGPAGWSIHASVKKGVVQPGTTLDFDADPILVSVPAQEQTTLEISGSTHARLLVTASAPQQLSFLADAPRLELGRLDGQSRSKIAAPELAQVHLDATILGVDLAQQIRLGPAHLSLPSLRVPNLFWLEPWLSRDGSLRADGAGSASVELDCDADHACELQKLRVDVSGARLAIRDRSSAPFSASLEGTHIGVPSRSGTKLLGQARVEISSARALLPLVTSLPIKDAISSLLALSRIKARLSTKQIADAYEVTLLEAESGNLTARGYLWLRRHGARGKVLLSTELMNVGVKLHDGDTVVKPLVSDEWLKTAER